MSSFKIVTILATLSMVAMIMLITVYKPIDREQIYIYADRPPSTSCDHPTNQFCSHLPIISIDTNKQKLELSMLTETIYTSNSITARINVYDNQDANHLSDTPEIVSGAIIKYRGNSSILFDKKSYKVNFIDQKQSENHVELMDMPAHDEWALNGPFLDKTMLRNFICLNIASEIMEWSPKARYCEMFVDGEYMGLYLAMETVARSPDRINIQKYNERDNFSGYILRSDRVLGFPAEIDTFTRYTKKMNVGTTQEIIYPPANRITLQTMEYVDRDFSSFEKALYSYDYNEKDFGYRKYIDVDSFVDYMIINEFFGNRDAGTFSTYFYKDPRGKIKIGPVWDFNNSCDNYMDSAHTTDGFFMQYRTEYNMLLKDEAFVNAVINRYRELRAGALDGSRLLQYINQTIGYLTPAIIRNNEKWGYSFDTANLNHLNKLNPDERNLKSYSAAAAQFKQYIINRGQWLDANIEILRQYSHESKVKYYNH